ncbi:MAG TPA: hypothetical protein PKK11_06910 [Methanothrix sp.]|nr:hypothetical protein [Methanothrix sp.]HPT19816.1 hypothetical protein [Methanothrix sp.]
MPKKKGATGLPDGQETPIAFRSIDRREEMLWIANEPPMPSAFPPCIKAIIARVRDKNEGEETQEKQEKQEKDGKEEKEEKDGKGRHRTAAILAAFLGQAGFSQERAKQLWLDVASVEESIFEKWFARMHCPKCRLLQRQSRGYPDLGIADLQLCRPDEDCAGFEGPVEYACRISPGDDGRKTGRLLHIRTEYRARIFDWSRGQEAEVDLTEDEKDDLEALLVELAGRSDAVLTLSRVKVRGRLRPRFYLRELEGPRRQMLSDII